MYVGPVDIAVPPVPHLTVALQPFMNVVSGVPTGDPGAAVNLATSTETILFKLYVVLPIGPIVPVKSTLVSLILYLEQFSY